MKKVEINLQTCGLLVFSAPFYHMYENRLTLIATVCDTVGKKTSMLDEKNHKIY